jgi:gliding motility-associated lipoprotein GldD
MRILKQIPGLVAAICLLLPACNSPFTPKPRGYFKVPFPEKKYLLFDKPGYPYTFEYPQYANVIKDSTYFDGAAENPWWINITFPQFDATVFVSYKTVTGRENFDKYIRDAFTLTGKHTVKATEKNDSLMITPNGVHGMYFQLGGNVATANQFFLTDTTRHFLRGALYFNATPNADSLQPMSRFLQEDVRHLINTLRWR